MASFGPRSVIELELIHRLAALFWRLRRASAIETGLFGLRSAAGYGERARLPHVARQPMKSVPPINGHGQFAFGADDWCDPKINAHKRRFGGVCQSADKSSKSRILAQSFLHLAKLDHSWLERAGAHEARCGVRLRKRFGSWSVAPPPPAFRGGRFENQSRTTFGIGTGDADYSGSLLTASRWAPWISE